MPTQLDSGHGGGGASLSTNTSTPPSPPPHQPANPMVLRPQRRPPLMATNNDRSLTDPCTIPVPDSLDGAVHGILHLPSEEFYRFEDGVPCIHTAAILLSGASGGLVGPSSIYLGMATKLSSLHQGIPTLRLDYRYPSRTKYCVEDVLAAMAYLEDTYSVKRFVLVGWSFGGAPVFTVGGGDPRVLGCATIASQTADTDGIRELAPTPVLLLHGLEDRTLDSWCSKSLYERYGSGKDGRRELKLFEGDDHALTKNAVEAEERLIRFVMKCAGVGMANGDARFIKWDVVDGNDRVKLMEKGGDLDEPESLK